MAAVSLIPADLAPFATIPEAKALAMIEDALAMAARVAPCIITDEFEYTAAAKAILRGAVLRWHDAGSGAVTQQQVGPFGQSIDTRQQRRGMFWPTEIEQLQDLCRGPEAPSGAFDVDTVGYGTAHAAWCSLVFGATYCSCGYDIAGYPIFEQA